MSLKNLFSLICQWIPDCGLRIPDCGLRIADCGSGFRFRIPVSDFRVLGLPLNNCYSKLTLIISPEGQEKTQV